MSGSAAGATGSPGIQVSKREVSRYVLGAQGLWPGRRYRGRAGVREALRLVGQVQVDPINVVARNHDLALHARVLDYRPQDLDAEMYRHRRFFDYGGLVWILPMSELPAWRVHMQRRRADRKEIAFAKEHRAVVEDVLRVLREAGPSTSRDFVGDGSGTRSGFRSGKLTAQALRHLWLIGEVMTHSRRAFERVYDLTENIAPERHAEVSSAEDADAFFARKAVTVNGLTTARAWRQRFARLTYRSVSAGEARERLQDLCDAGSVTQVGVEGHGDIHYMDSSRGDWLRAVAEDRVPDAWRVVENDTHQEVLLLPPLDYVVARGRSLEVFDFEHLFEAYKPAPKRRWGAYTMPVLWGDAMVARLDLRAHRDERALVVADVWLERPELERDEEFAVALSRALARMSRLCGLDRLDADAVRPRRLRAAIGDLVTEQLAEAGAAAGG